LACPGTRFPGLPGSPAPNPPVPGWLIPPEPVRDRASGPAVPGWLWLPGQHDPGPSGSHG